MFVVFTADYLLGFFPLGEGLRVRSGFEESLLFRLASEADSFRAL